MTSSAIRTIAWRALPLVDLTDLSEDSSRESVEHLCADAETRHGPVAAVCVWPRFVSLAHGCLAGTDIHIATVVNFPAGGEDIAATVSETRQAREAGADEIDLVMPYRAVMEGRTVVARAMIDAVKDALAGARLKVILETGELGDEALIRRAADIAIEAGADFLKTSTGKVPVNATPEAAEIMLTAIRDSGRPVGFKAAGGLRTVADAGTYLALADRIMDPDWVSPATFRFGASSLLTDLKRAID